MSRPLSSEYSVKHGFSININLGKNLEIWRNAVMNQDIDCFVLVDGKEGSGKSVCGKQIGYLLDKDHHIDLDTQVCFTPEEVKKAITTLPKYKAIIYDEAKRGLNRRRSTEKTNTELTELFAECRQNNLFLVVIMPSFYDMDMNVAVWRSRILVHVWYEWDLTKPPGQQMVRGFARFYNENGKKNMYCNKMWRQRYEYKPIPNQSFDFKFPHHYVVDESKYRAKKKQAVKDFEESTTVRPVCSACHSENTRYNKTKGVWSCNTCGFLLAS